MTFSEQHQAKFRRAEVEPFRCIVRSARLTDLVDLVEVLFSCFHPQPGIMSWLRPLVRLGIYEDFQQRLRSPQSSEYICLVATTLSKMGCSSRIVGTVEVAIRPAYFLLVSSAPHPYLSNLAVHSDYRRQGIAQKLLSACEEFVVERGCLELYLHVLEDNQPAKQLYLKAGYQVQAAEPLWYGWLLNRPRRLLLHKRFPKSEV